MSAIVEVNAPQAWDSEGAVSLSRQEPLLDTEVKAGPPDGRRTHPLERNFSPYASNGGSTLAIGGQGFCVVAGDTRLSSGYEVLSRDSTKLFQLTSKCILAMAGCRTDQQALFREMKFKIEMYMHKCGKEMSTQSVAQLLSTTLYGRRFFPFYSFCLLAGLSEDGNGDVYNYDAIGSFQRNDSSSQGSAQKYIIPVLDNMVEFKNRLDPKPAPSEKEVVEICKYCFISAGERDIYVGDAVEIAVITKDGIAIEKFALKKD